MDIVYPLGKGSIYGNLELRMSLRSVEKHLRSVDRVYIIGERPSWLTNVVHIPAKDIHTIPDRNIMEKILIACNHPDVSDDFLFINDDHYLLTEFDSNTFPYFYSEDLQQYTERRAGPYGNRAKDTMNFLKKSGLPTLYFDIHYPIKYNKQKFIDTVSPLPWKTTRDGFILKSLYCNTNQVEPRRMQDFKVSQRPPIHTALAFSTYAHISPKMKEYLSASFPTRSKYELD